MTHHVGRAFPPLFLALIAQLVSCADSDGSSVCAEAMSIDSSERLIVLFGAEWAGPVRMIKPAWGALVDEFSNIRTREIDIDSEPEIASVCSVSSIPTLIAFANGQEIERIVGAVDESQIRRLFDSLRD